MPVIPGSFGHAGVPNLVDIWQSYCADRGITAETLALLSGKLLDKMQLSKILSNNIFGSGVIGGYVFPASGSAPCDHAAARMFYAPNDPTPRPGYSTKAPPKYLRSKGSPGYLYVPPVLTDWNVPEAKYDLIIGEGQLSAARLAQDGFHAVGLSGKDCYRVGDKHSPVIPELKQLVLSERTQNIIVMYDSDSAEKADVQVALAKLMRDLIHLRPNRSNTLFTCTPPCAPNGDKMGPDDFLQRVGLGEFTNYLLTNKFAWIDHTQLQIERKAAERYIYDPTNGEFWDADLRLIIKPDHLDRNLLMEGRFITLDKGREGVYSHKMLLNSPLIRSAAGGRQYNPATDQEFFVDEAGVGYINKHNPEDIPKAVKGDVSIAYELMQSVCRDDPTAIQKLLVVSAKHAQYPATHPKYGIILVGEQRAGKSNLAKLIGTSLSKRYHSGRVTMDSNFNDHWRGFACKEWAEFDPKMDEEWLKDLITSESYEVNGKNKQPYYENNYTLNIFTANGLRSKLQEGDRRFVVGGYAVGDDQRLGLEFERWVQGPGASYFRYHLLNDIDASGYEDLDTWTSVKAEVEAASKTFRGTVKDEIITVLNEVEGLEIITGEALNLLLEPYDINTISFIKSNMQYFVKPALEVVKIKGKPTRFRAFKNLSKWRVEKDTEKYREQFDLIAKLFNKKF